MNKEKMQLFADNVIKPIMEVVDNARNEFDIEELNDALKDMVHKASMQRAWPTPDSQAKAKESDEINALFGAVLDVIKARNEQVDGRIKAAKEQAAWRSLGLL